MTTNNKKLTNKFALICFFSFIGATAGMTLAPHLLNELRKSIELPIWGYPVILLVLAGIALVFFLSLPAALRYLRKDGK